jgi:hypothetical protein
MKEESKMVYPNLTTMLVGVALLAVLLGIDWLTWGRLYASDVRRKREMRTEPKREGRVFKKAA